MIEELNQGRYLPEAELGRGGMGVVYRARDTLLDRQVAIKLVSADRLGSEAQDRLLQEAQAAARLNHPNIVAVYDVGREQLPGQSGAASYIVMELVAGESLRDYEPASMDEIVALGRQISAALEQAHERGIIHRDLKPENVLLSSVPGDEPPTQGQAHGLRPGPGDRPESPYPGGHVDGYAVLHGPGSHSRGRGHCSSFGPICSWGHALRNDRRPSAL